MIVYFVLLFIGSTVGIYDTLEQCQDVRAGYLRMEPAPQPPLIRENFRCARVEIAAVDELEV